MGERRVRVRGVYRFSSLVKQNKKAKICFVIYIAGFFLKKNFCYEVFAKQKKKKCAANYYSCTYPQGTQREREREREMSLLG